MSLESLNAVEWEQVSSELEPSELARFSELEIWLDLGPDRLKTAYSIYDSEGLTKSFRSAPSIVIRSEAELFGISMPRFAYRAIFKNSAGMIQGFVNLRRIRSFIRAVAKRLEVGTQAEFLTKLQQKCRCIADSFLAVPSWASNYHVVTTDLARWYAEDGPDRGTPFVTHFAVGGGMCAQAVCFMASALLHEFAKGIFGVAEVTMLASQKEEEPIKLLNFSGLDLLSLVQYFRHSSVGLFADVQCAESVEEYRRALRAYVLSGFPVVIPLDMRWLRETAYRQLPGRPYRQHTASDSPERHAVLVIGVSKASNDQYDLLIHDPATFPYLKISTADLFKAAMTVGSSRGAHMLPITPTDEQGPLLSTYGLDDSQVELTSQRGLLRWMREASKASDIPRASGQLWLIDMEHLERAPRVIANTNINDRLRQTLKSWFATHPDSRWAWLEVDAIVKDGAVATLWRNRDKPTILAQMTWNSVKEEWQTEPGVPEQTNVQHAAPDAENVEPADQRLESVEAPKLKLSLISSFCAGGERMAEQAWLQIQQRPPMERYIWMQADVDQLLNGLLGDNHGVQVTAVDALAAINPESELMGIIGEKYRMLKSRAIALATFIPEIAEAPSSDRGKRAQRAIRFLGELAMKLNAVQQSLSGSDRITRIELVAGSRIGRVYQSLPLQGGAFEFIAEVLPIEEVHRNIVQNLNAVLEDLKFRKRLEDQDIAFVFEQEPGPLFALGFPGAMSSFCDRLEKTPYREWKKLVGINLDLAHWQMSKITAGDIKSSLRMRIAHAHISGHHPKAHFGDCQLDQSHEPRYRELVSVLKSYCTPQEHQFRKDHGYPTFSGYVSVEFEAAPSVTSVETTLHLAHQILK